MVEWRLYYYTMGGTLEWGKGEEGVRGWKVVHRLERAEVLLKFREGGGVARVEKRRKGERDEGEGRDGGPPAVKGVPR